MPRKAKDEINEDLNLVVSTNKNNVTKKATSTNENKLKKNTTSKASSNKKSTSTKASSNEGTAKKRTTKKVEAKKSTSVKASSKKSTSTKASSDEGATKKRATKKVASGKSSTAKVSISEYYDLPAQYEQTLVKILAQTPTILFVYWDISNLDRQNLLKQYGENFFNETYPLLLIINKTKNYQFEVEINDYANSWYLHIPDSDCEYEVILMRKNKHSHIIVENNGTVTITSSNKLETPNDHILFEKLGKTVFFKDVKNNFVQEKNITSFSLIHNIGRIYNIYDLYKEIYKNELNNDELGFGLSSSNFSSNFK